MLADQFQRLQCAGTGQHVLRLAQVAFQLQRLALQQVGQQVAALHHATQAVQVTVAHQHPRMRRRHQAGDHVVVTARHVDPLHVGTHGHHAGHRAVSQAQHAADHLVLGRLQAFLGAAAFIGFFFIVAVGLARAQQAQHCIGGTLAERLALLVALAVETYPLVERFHQDRERDGRVQVPLRNPVAQALGHQAETDHQQEAQAQHHHRRVLVDEAGQRLAGQQHQHHRDGHCRIHDAEVVDHADGGDHRVQREHRIEHHDLRHHHREAGVDLLAIFVMLAAFQPLVQFHRALEQQEQSAAQQDQITPGEAVLEQGDQRFGQFHDPGQRGQQHQPHQQRQCQPDHPRAVALVRRQLVGQDRDEHQVVDAENDLQHDQGCKAHPYRGVSQPFHFRSVSSVRGK
ncbi:hypothetical protein D3C71_1004320 [compost metagenome]